MSRVQINYDTKYVRYGISRDEEIPEAPFYVAYLYSNESDAYAIFDSFDKATEFCQNPGNWYDEECDWYITPSLLNKIMYWSYDIEEGHGKRIYNV